MRHVPPHAWWSRRFTLRAETLALLVSLWFTLACNPLLWSSLHQLTASSPRQLALLAAMATLVTALHFILLALLLNRWSTRPLLSVLIPVTALAAYYMQHYHLYLDPEMLRNVLHTNPAEAAELLNWQLLPALIALAAPPLWLVWRSALTPSTWLPALLRRTGSIAIALLLGGGAALAVFQDFSSLMRQHKEVRYLITPSNYLYALARVAGSEARAVEQVIETVGSDAAPASTWEKRKKPVMLVLVLGETARAANWQLSGYGRDTNPELRREDLINYPQVTACGTSTEVSVPCMFSPWGRRNYDEDRIRRSESLLHVLRRAGFKVVWLDNQSGCKGVCRDLDVWRPAPGDPGCDGSECHDEALLAGMRKLTPENEGNVVYVLHQIGNHGPAYHRRYPTAFRHFTPACESSDLGQCSSEEIRNAYDNALRYTDHVVANVITYLKQQQHHDAAMLYLSDHGESLGEKGLYLHGAPYAFAPDVQKQVPMALWLSAGYAQSFAMDTGCLAANRQQPLSHDHLFHSVLGMLDVRTDIYDASHDFTRPCRAATLLAQQESSISEPLRKL